MKDEIINIINEVECKKCGEKIYIEFQANEKFIFKCPNCSSEKK